MGTTVEELKREVGKLKGHILSQVEKCNADSLVTTFSGRGADEGEKGNGKFQVFCFQFCWISASISSSLAIRPVRTINFKHPNRSCKTLRTSNHNLAKLINSQSSEDAIAPLRSGQNLWVQLTLLQPKIGAKYTFWKLHFCQITPLANISLLTTLMSHVSMVTGLWD